MSAKTANLHFSLSRARGRVFGVLSLEPGSRQRVLDRAFIENRVAAT